MPRVLWILIFLASLKILVALPIFAFVTLLPDADSPFPSWLYAGHLAVFSAFGFVLLAGGRRDRRAQLLGAVFVLAASLFANRPLGRFPAGESRLLSGYIATLRLIEPGAFRSLLVWMFASTFPREAATGRVRLVALAGTVLSAVLGTALFVQGLFELMNHLRIGDLAVAAVDIPGAARSLQLNTILTLGGLLFVVLNMRATEIVERRRAELFVWALLFGTGPILFQAAAESSIAAYGDFMRRPLPRLWSGLILYPLLWSGLATAAYAVYAREVLTVRLVIRRAIRYALAKATIVALVVVPFAVLLALLYRRRGQALEEILSRDQLALMVLAGAGLIVLRLRPRLLEALDRRFFREHYDAKLILRALIDDTGGARTIASLTARLSAEIDRALHVDGVTLLTSDRNGQFFRSAAGTENTLPSGAALLTLLKGDTEPMDVDLDTPQHPLQRLPQPERKWLELGRYRLLVPVRSSTGALIGVLALGRKRSELPYSSGDRWLLSSIAASAAVAIENVMLRSSGAAGIVEAQGPEEMPSDAAHECERCFAIQQRTSASHCAACGGSLRDAPVPRAVRGYRIERRVGAGGMGVVYRAIDVNLRRMVAIKTLSAVSAVEAERLRREARAMAAVAHPNIATIFAVEVWHGQPLLIVEYFERGTLGDDIKRGALDPEKVLTIGTDLCAGLEHIHTFGMLHRDIKPTNIAVANNGAAKLLDFGLAKASPAELQQLSGSLNDPETDGAMSSVARMTPSGILAGTPLYFSPELLNTYTPNQQSDLWSLALSLFEAIAGRNPMNAPSLPEMLERIRRGIVPDLRRFKPDVRSEVAAVFADALHAEPERRPHSAAEFRHRLEATRLRVSPG